MSNLNNNDCDIRNRGVELMLKEKGGGVNSNRISKKFCFEQTLTFFDREFTFKIEFSRNKKSNSLEK
jgi:hypothetical protein